MGDNEQFLHLVPRSTVSTENQGLQFNWIELHRWATATIEFHYWLLRDLLKLWKESYQVYATMHHFVNDSHGHHTL
jgi:hypothetical protein